MGTRVTQDSGKLPANFGRFRVILTTDADIRHIDQSIMDTVARGYTMHYITFTYMGY